MSVKVKFDENGHEINDLPPVRLETPLRLPPTKLEKELMQRRLIRQELSEMARQQGQETFEEADDFDVEDEGFEDYQTPYEMVFDPILGREVSPEMVRQDQDRFRKEYIAAAEKRIAEYSKPRGTSEAGSEDKSSQPAGDSSPGDNGEVD